MMGNRLRTVRVTQCLCSIFLYRKECSIQGSRIPLNIRISLVSSWSGKEKVFIFPEILRNLLLCEGWSPTTPRRELPARGSAWWEDRAHGKNGELMWLTIMATYDHNNWTGWVPEIQARGLRLPNWSSSGTPEQRREKEGGEGDQQEEKRGSPLPQAADCWHDGARRE